MNKIIKYAIFVVAILLIVGLVVYFSDPNSSVDRHKSESMSRELTQAIDKDWSDKEGWDAEVYNNLTERINRQANDGYIDENAKSTCINHLNEVALRKTDAALNTLWADAACSKVAVDAQITGIRKIAEDPAFQNEEKIKRQLGIYSEYTAALAFAGSSCNETPSYTPPTSFSTFSGQSFRNKAASIKANQYWDVISNISTIKNGLSESTINQKVADGKRRFADGMAAKVIAAYKGRARTLDNYYDLEKSQRAYNSQFGSNANLNSFVRNFYEDV
ncbi:MAG: hypothetical protein NC097_04525 [Clostridium sp.]|nr:hypothetical protein [Prevotella sp.]MCM1429043.1 hypothetical protein [Clostridium sp.]